MSGVAIVTGSNKGLGLALVKGLCEKYNGPVYLTSRNEKLGQQACRELEKFNLKPNYHQLDVNNEESIQRFRCHLQERNLKANILINNAGILFLKDAKEPKLYQAEETIKINFLALVNFTESLIPLIKNGGKILNISSSSGHLSRIPSEELRKRFLSPDLVLEELKSLIAEYILAVKENRDIECGWGESPYVVSKVGVNAYTFILHRRLHKTGIQVNCVHPGYVISDMTKGVGSVSPDEAAVTPLTVALSDNSGQYVWHDGTVVPWDGPDPRAFIDGKQL